jgi:hypothetical protein
MRRIVMNVFAKSALVLGAIGTVAIGSTTASEARSGRWVAGAAGFAVGAAVGAAAANAAAYNSGYYYGGPAYAYGPAYDSYAYAPGYTYAPAPAYSYGYYDSSYGYNTNTLSPWQDRKMRGTDY